VKFEKYVKERERLFDLQPLGGGKETSNLLWASNSLGGETGEFQNIVKKIYRDYNGKITDGKLHQMKDELGDILWYWLFVCDILKLKPEELMEYNLEKLKKRHNIE